MTEIPSSTTLYFGPWYRRSPYFESTLRAGCKAYDIYNKMYLPAEYDDPEVEYRALNDGVTLWDVGVERTVQVSGPDADRLIDMLTCRDLTKCAVKQGKYMLVIAPDGGIVNDPVLLHVDENMWWMQLADSDAGLYALGVLSQSGLDAEVTLSGRPPGAGAGPACRRRRSRSSSATAIYDIRYYWCDRFVIGDIPVVDQPHRLVGRARVRGEPARRRRAAAELWDAIMAAGEEFGIRPIAPNEARRVEAGIFNWGSDMTLARHAVPRHGPRAPGRGAAAGLHRQGRARARPPRGRRPQAGRDRVRPRRSRSRASRRAGPPATPACRSGRSPTRCGRRASTENIGYVWVPIELAEPGHADRRRLASTAPPAGARPPIPFVDPRKERPAGSLRRTAG